MKKSVLPFLFLSLVLAGGCGGASSPAEKAARRFMDHYYVKTNLQSASEEADGYALEKIKKSLQLTEGQVVDAGTHRPKITYSLLEFKTDGGEADYLFQVVIEPEKMSPIRKKTLVKVRKRESGEWKVTQFSDYEMPHE